MGWKSFQPRVLYVRCTLCLCFWKLCRCGVQANGRATRRRKGWMRRQILGHLGIVTQGFVTLNTDHQTIRKSLAWLIGVSKFPVLCFSLLCFDCRKIVCLFLHAQKVQTKARRDGKLTYTGGCFGAEQRRFGGEARAERHLLKRRAEMHGEPNSALLHHRFSYLQLDTGRDQYSIYL
jgi:hypothetical protein